MGREVERLCHDGYRGAELVVGVDPSVSGAEALPVFSKLSDVVNVGAVDCVVDFSHHSSTEELLEFCKSNSLPVVVATTGHTESELAAVRAAAREIPVFFSYNMSLGVALLVELAKKAAAAMPEADIEIIEKHHNRKLDAPSGTALMIADAIAEVRPSSFAKTGRAGQGKRSRDEIGIHAVRLGNVVGEHEVIVASQNQTISLKHEAHSRSLFAEGALAAAAFIVDKGAGLYDMKSLVAEGEPRVPAVSEP